jgi:hypothetical protein
MIDSQPVVTTLVEHGWITEDPELLKLKDRFYGTVAHAQASHGWRCNVEAVKKLEDTYTNTPLDEYVYTILKNNKKFITERDYNKCKKCINVNFDKYKNKSFKEAKKLFLKNKI